MRNKPILCVDFDGCIHLYTTPWTNEFTISDGPVPGALEWLWRATEMFDVQVYSSRSKSEDARRAMLIWMRHYSAEVFGVDHPMAYRDNEYPIGFAAEKPAAFLTIDDRCIPFEGNWADLDAADLLKFKPWNKRAPAS